MLAVENGWARAIGIDKFTVAQVGPRRVPACVWGDRIPHTPCSLCE